MHLLMPELFAFQFNILDEDYVVLFVPSNIVSDMFVTREDERSQLLSIVDAAASKLGCSHVFVGLV